MVNLLLPKSRDTCNLMATTSSLSVLRQKKKSADCNAECIDKKCVLDDLPLEAYQAYTDMFEKDLYDEISLETCVSKRISEGGTSVSSVEKQICFVREEISK